MSGDEDSRLEQQWCAGRRGAVASYLKAQRVAHGRIGEWPAWHVAPYVSIWAIESKTKPGWVGWWVISGDLPDDYVSADAIKHPREALRAFARRWREAARRMAEGRPPSDITIGAPSDALTLAPMLQSRAETLAEWANDDTLWEDEAP